MSKVVLDISMSLDGYVTGPNVRAEEPMGDGGEGLHAWMSTDTDAFEAVNASVGATIIGRRTFDLGLKPWGGTPWPGIPSFVVTHHPKEDLQGDNGGTFAFDGLHASVERAKQAAGQKDVIVLGADVGRNLLQAALLDEIWIHLAPLLLGDGTPLFQGQQTTLLPIGEPVGGAATHLRFSVPK
jgi:dihydrofolate reductase